MHEIPAGFERHYRRSPLTDPWEPIYSRRTEKAVVLALRSSDNHTNSRGFVHGGLLTALADNAMGLSCAVHLDKPERLVTVGLGIDFLKPARRDQWVEIDTQFVKVGGTICFAQAFVSADGEICARANGTFRIIREPTPANSEASS